MTIIQHRDKLSSTHKCLAQLKRKHDSFIIFFCVLGNKEQRHNEQQHKKHWYCYHKWPRILESHPQYKTICVVRNKCKTFKIKVV